MDETQMGFDESDEEVKTDAPATTATSQQRPNVMQYYHAKPSCQYMHNRADYMAKTKFAEKLKQKSQELGMPIIPAMNRPSDFQLMSSKQRNQNTLWVEPACLEFLRGTMHIPALLCAQADENGCVHVYVVFEGDEKYKQPSRECMITGDTVTQLLSQVRFYHPKHPTVISPVILHLLHLLAHRFADVRFLSHRNRDQETEENLDSENVMTIEKLFQSCGDDNKPKFHYMVLQRHSKTDRPRLESIFNRFNPDESNHDDPEARQAKEDYFKEIGIENLQVTPVEDGFEHSNDWALDGPLFYEQLQKFVSWSNMLVTYANSLEADEKRTFTLADMLFPYYHDYSNDSPVPSALSKTAKRFISDSASVSVKKNKSRALNSEDDDDDDSEDDDDYDEEDGEDDEDEDDDDEDDDDEDESPEAMEVDLRARKQMSKKERNRIERVEAAEAMKMQRQIDKKRRKEMQAQRKMVDRMRTTKRTQQHGGHKRKSKIVFLPEGASEEDESEESEDSEESDDSDDEDESGDEEVVDRKLKAKLEHKKRRTEDQDTHNGKPLPKAVAATLVQFEAIAKKALEDARKSLVNELMSTMSNATTNKSVDNKSGANESNQVDQPLKKVATMSDDDDDDF